MSDKKEDTKSTILDKIPFLKKLKTIKHIEIIIFAIFIIIALLIAFSGSNPFSFLTSTSGEQTVETSTYSYFSTLDYIRSQEEKLTSLLKNVDGVENVQVMLSVKNAGEIVYAKNIQEKTVGSTTTKTESVVFVTNDGKSTPLILMEKLPEIAGVVVISQGAKDVKVKLNIVSILSTALGLSSDKINVLV